MSWGLIGPSVNGSKNLTIFPLLNLGFVCDSTSILIISPVGFAKSILAFVKKAFPSWGANMHPFLIFLASSISSTLGKPWTISTVFSLS